ncbi:hypothetical protein PsAD2_03228 [Pseudovibrio axinellae]|uniref:Uncharacterized protein n=1 Tax=Pseudovibrio axinellae TaxID=989403 RepID=A0A165WY10_9HYPH|nr:hypothetical protein [Pseudovibrio axinellae]KZL17025.1 hypothetical protein PsAD2_03228 [Pseudovibrio axinellae]SEQ16616.1 hypothetical protein SAMN05421798_10233 [Pseudovibrio axinellae]
MTRPLIISIVLLSAVLSFSSKAWAVTPRDTSGPGLTQLHGPAVSALKPLTAKSKLVRVYPKSKLTRYRVKPSKTKSAQ